MNQLAQYLVNFLIAGDTLYRMAIFWEPFIFNIFVHFSISYVVSLGYSKTFFNFINNISLLILRDSVFRKIIPLLQNLKGLIKEVCNHLLLVTFNSCPLVLLFAINITRNNIRTKVIDVLFVVELYSAPKEKSWVFSK